MNALKPGPLLKSGVSWVLGEFFEESTEELVGTSCRTKLLSVAAPSAPVTAPVVTTFHHSSAPPLSLTLILLHFEVEIASCINGIFST